VHILLRFIACKLCRRFHFQLNVIIWSEPQFELGPNDLFTFFSHAFNLCITVNTLIILVFLRFENLQPVSTQSQALIGILMCIRARWDSHLACANNSRWAGKVFKNFTKVVGKAKKPQEISLLPTGLNAHGHASHFPGKQVSIFSVDKCNRLASCWLLFCWSLRQLKLGQIFAFRFDLSGNLCLPAFTYSLEEMVHQQLTRTVTRHHHWLIILGRETVLFAMARRLISKIFCYLSAGHFRSRFSQEEIS